MNRRRKIDNRARRRWRHSLRLAAALALMAGAANAQSNCGPRATVVAQLADKYSETRQSIGLTGGDKLVETFANTRSGTWTVIVSTAAGVSCIVAAGQAYQSVVEALPPNG